MKAKKLEVKEKIWEKCPEHNSFWCTCEKKEWNGLTKTK